ncbi:MAG: CAP domain-containing protein [Caulobacteraceae bacterium]|nr:CAP domain-containing protein [Caulobacteraceae bacterium]
MQPLRNVLRLALASAAVMASLAFVILPQSAVGQIYQDRRTDEFPEPMVLEGRPTIWLGAAARTESDPVLYINVAVRKCDRAQFDENRRHVARYRDVTARWVTEMRGILASERARLELHQTKLEKAEAQKARAKTPEEMAAASQLVREESDLVAFMRRELDQTIRILQRVTTELQSIDTLLGWIDDAWDDAGCQPLPPRPTSSRCLDSQGLFDEINRARLNPAGYAAGWRGADADVVAFLRNRPPSPALTQSPMLDAAAQQHADDQTRAGFTGHRGSDGSTPMRRIQGAGLFSTMTAEVIAVGQTSPSDVVRQLITDRDSPTKAHREDLFDPDFVLVGVGCGEDERAGRLVVFDLANPPTPRNQ